MTTSPKTSLPLDKHDWHPSPLPGQIVLVTTVGQDGEPNVAPKSWLAMVAFGPPPVLMLGCNLEHATAKNILAEGSFVVNIPGEDLLATCWVLGSEPHVRGRARFERHGLTPLPAERVVPPRIAECRAHLECELDNTSRWGQEVALFGRIVAASVDQRALDGDEAARYRALGPVFFLERQLAAGLGPARSPQAAGADVRPVLTILAVADVERAVSFYREAFGWRVRVEVPVYVELELPDGRGLGLYQREGFARNTGAAPAAVPEGSVTGTEIYLHCEDLEGAMARVEAAGGRLLSPLAARPWGDEAAYFADPDGNVVVVARPLRMASAGTEDAS